MKQDNTLRTVLYIVIIASSFVILFVLDTALKAHYAPEEQRLERTKTEVEHSSHVQSASLTVVDAEKDASLPPKDQEATQVDSGSTDSVEKLQTETENAERYFQKLQEKYRTEILSKLPPRKSRTDITIRYYKHPPDGSSAYALQSLGFYIHERPVDPGYENFQSNAIYYGDSVRLEDIQLVAFTLLKEGLPLKTIAPSKFGNSWKSHAIEVGADSTLTTKKTLTLSEIQQLSH